MVADDGPGFPHAGLTERGRSNGGSTGLGLDIARRIAEGSGGTLTIGQSASGGGSVTVGLGPLGTPAEGSRRHRRTRNGLPLLPPALGRSFATASGALGPGGLPPGAPSAPSGGSGGLLPRASGQGHVTKSRGL